MKFGADCDNTFLNENFSYFITDSSQFPADTPLTFAFPTSDAPNAGDPILNNPHSHRI